MVDTVQPVNVVINEQISPKIVTDIRAIGEAALAADKSIATLRASLMSLHTAQANIAAASAAHTNGMNNVVNATNAATHGTARFKTELLVLAHELSQGRFTRFAGSLMVLAQYGGVASTIFSGLGLSVLAAGLAVVEIGLFAQRAASQMATFNNEIIATGGFVGKTADQLHTLAQQLATETNSRLSTTNAVLNQLVSSGRITGDALKYIAASSLILAKETGEDADKIAKDFEKMGDGATKYAIDFNDHYHVLTAAQISYIRKLQEQGETEKAQQLLSEQIYKGLADRATENLTWIGRQWQNLGIIIDGVAEKIDRVINGASLATKIAEIKADIASRSNSPLGQSGGLFGTPVAELQKQLVVLQKQLDTDNASIKAKAEITRQNELATHAEQKMVDEFDRFNKGEEKAVDVIKRLHAEMAQIAAVNPNSPKLKEFQANIDAIEARIRKRYDPAGTAAANKLAKEEETYASAIAKTNKQLDDKIRELGLLGPAREEQAQLDRIEEQYIKSKIPLQATDLLQIKDKIQLQASIARASNELNRIYAANQGEILNIAAAYRANEEALKRNLITSQQYNLSLRDLGQRALELKIKIGDAHIADALLAALGRVVQGYKGVIATLADDFTSLFETIENGSASAFSQVILGQETAKEAIRQLSGEILTSLIGSLIKLGEQYVLNAVIGQSLAAAATATTAGEAAALSAAWAEPAALASLATVGGNSAAAIAGGVAASAAFKVMAAVPAFASGGLVRGPGTGTSDSITARLSDHEFIVNAQATRRFLPLLRAINENRYSGGGSVGKPNGYAGAVPTQSGGMNVSIYNYGSARVTTKQLTPNDVAIMIRDQAPDVIASNIAQPNSRVSKSLSQNINAGRRLG